MVRNTFEIFLSSTSQDLQDCRDAVRSMIGRMRETTIAMETFGARPNKPLETCRQEVAASDAMVVIVGHRYGWIPTVAQGGDGRRSITWWEVTWALDAGKPVYAFLIDPKARWEGERTHCLSYYATMYGTRKSGRGPETAHGRRTACRPDPNGVRPGFPSRVRRACRYGK